MHYLSFIQRSRVTIVQVELGNNYHWTTIIIRVRFHDIQFSRGKRYRTVDDNVSIVRAFNTESQ